MYEPELKAPFLSYFFASLNLEVRRGVVQEDAVAQAGVGCDEERYAELCQKVHNGPLTGGPDPSGLDSSCKTHVTSTPNQTEN